MKVHETEYSKQVDKRLIQFFMKYIISDSVFKLLEY